MVRGQQTRVQTGDSAHQAEPANGTLGPPVETLSFTEALAELDALQGVLQQLYELADEAQEDGQEDALPGSDELVAVVKRRQRALWSHAVALSPRLDAPRWRSYFGCWPVYDDADGVPAA